MAGVASVAVAVTSVARVVTAVAVAVGSLNGSVCAVFYQINKKFVHNNCPFFYTV